MIYFSAKLFVLASLAVSSIATPIYKRDFELVKADVKAISDQVTVLNNDIHAFPNSGGTLSQALKIHTDATKLMGLLKTGTSDVTAHGSFTSEQGKTAIGAVEAFEPTILDALKTIVDKKPALQALPIGGIVGIIKQDLGFLNSNTTAFENALIAASPVDLKDRANSIKVKIDQGFATAIAAYA